MPGNFECRSFGSFTRMAAEFGIFFGAAARTINGLVARVVDDPSTDEPPEGGRRGPVVVRLAASLAVTGKPGMPSPLSPERRSGNIR